MIEVTIDCGDLPSVGARVALTHLGQLMGRGVTNSQGWASFPVTAPQDTWTMVLTVHGQDARLYEKLVYAAARAVRARHSEPLRGADANARLDRTRRVTSTSSRRTLRIARDRSDRVLRSLSPYAT